MSRLKNQPKRPPSDYFWMLAGIATASLYAYLLLSMLGG